MTAPANSARAYSNPVEALQNPEVRKYFTALFSSDISPEEKYDTVIRFFALEIDLEKQLLTPERDRESGGHKKIFGTAVEARRDAEVWQPELILQQTEEGLLQQTEEGLRRALKRVGRSQHQDGGWGYRPELSHPWATAWTVLLLHQARDLGFDDGTRSISRGLEWLVDNRGSWSLDADEIHGVGNSVFEAAVALRCVLATGAASQPAVRRSIERSIARLLDEQKAAGNWEPTLFGRGYQGERGVSWHDVAATSFAVQALAEASSGAAVQAAGQAVRWLIGEQNENGSWNGFLTVPHTPRAVPSVNKTCDALKGLLAGRRLGIDVSLYQARIEKAVRWMLEQEEAVFSNQGKITGWAWKSEENRDTRSKELNFLENTCLSLDTLLEIEPFSESVSLPQLAANALWLLRQQLRADGGLDGDPDDGKWPNDDTGRIAFPILKFYSRITSGSLFKLAPTAPAEPERSGAAQIDPDATANPLRQGTT